MTTIGTAVLQIIPSLKGVTDAIEKQIDGKVVEVKIAPKVDKAAASAAGKDVGTAIATEAKEAVRKGDVGKAVADEVKSSVKKAAPGKEIGKAVAEDVKESVKKASPGKDIAKAVSEDVKKSSPGRDIAKVIFEGLADGVKQGLPRGGVAETIVDGISKNPDTFIAIGTDLVAGIGKGIKASSGIIDALKDGVKNADFKSVGDLISGGLKGGLGDLKTALSGITAADVGAGLDSVVDGLRKLEDIGLPPELADTLSKLSGPLETMAQGGKANAIKGISDGLVAMAPAIQDMTGLDLSGVVDPLERISAVAGGVSDMAVSLGALRVGAIALGGASVVTALEGFVAAAAPILAIAAAIAYVIAYGKPDKIRGDAPPPVTLGGPPLPAGIQVPKGFEVTNGQLHQVGTPVPAPSVPPLQTPAIPPDMQLPTGFEVGPDGQIRKKPGHAGGGQVFGAGTGTSDSILAWLSDEEFVVNADATRKNLPLLEIINSGKLPGFSTGGLVGPDVAAAENLVGTPYSTAKRFDCSGDVARVINAALGQNGGLMTTATAAEWLAARGFKPGIGGPGTISVGWKNGGPGGGHMAMTLSDGRNAEGGGSHPNFLIGGGAAGASSPQFTDHMFLPIVAAQASGQGEGDQAPADSAAPVSGSGGGRGAGVSLPSSLSGLSSFALNGLGTGVGVLNSGKDLSDFGKAAGSAVSGQVSSALGVFGIDDAPPILQAASKLIGGLKVGGHDPSGASDGSIFSGSNLLNFGQGNPGSAAPLSAIGAGGGVAPPDDAHGARAGQPPGVTNIYAADAEGALAKWQRIQDQRVAAKLDHL